MAQRNGGNSFVLITLWSAWLLAFGASFVSFHVTEATGDGFVRGMNRVGAFLGWQGVACVLALAVWGVGRDWPKGSATRRISLVPIAFALLLIAGIAALFLWAYVGV